MQKSRNLIFFNLSCRLRNITFYHSWVSIHETKSIFAILGDPNSVATKRRENREDTKIRKKEKRRQVTEKFVYITERLKTTRELQESSFPEQKD